MEESESQVVAFNIILHSGNARTDIHEAMNLMRESKFDDVEKALSNANEELILAHQSQTKLLQQFSQGAKIEMHILMVHAQDHLMTTMTLLEMVKELPFLYQKIEGRHAR